ncbi:hypothetical protein E2F50_03100 [Rhizobium deserti]|uniref:Sulfotransferase family protein n=1 Tax=Rhizobium deserti TaxID=2547961 RepID=A0A4R5UML8_9HYPH|nr:hypothetical protein [Rhizobium deserti]TDK39132.1 hypothetical protein E2F50_03100 [Rhizobium deserti]
MSNHLLIAGTGRSGTSLLVRLLTKLGLETHVSASGEANWYLDANAGLEDLVHHADAKLPYVAKSPWLYEFVDSVLARDDITIDGVIIPVRNLAEAASSRVVVELQNSHRNHPWMTAEDKVWENWGATPGGVLYSLNPLDEARLLAVGFHHLVERLANAGIPTYLLAFPRFTHDAEYFYSVLKGCLPSGVNVEDVKATYEVVDPDKIRVGTEIAGGAAERIVKSPEKYPSLEELDNAALRRELIKIRGELVSSAASLTETSASLADFQGRNATLEEELRAVRSQQSSLQEELAAKLLAETATGEKLSLLHARTVDLEHELNAAEARILGLEEEVAAKSAAEVTANEELSIFRAQCPLMEREIEALRMRIRGFERALSSKTEELENERLVLKKVRGSASWRITAPLRRVGRLLPKN